MSRFRLWRDRRGVAALEFALIAPVFLVMYVVGVDVVLVMRNRLRVDQAAVQGTQVIAQFTSLYADDFTTTFYPVIQTLAGSSNNKVLNDPNQVACAATISGLDYPASGARQGLLSIVWQKSFTNGTCTANKVGSFDAATATPTAPNLKTYVPPSGLPFIVVEVASQYKLIGLSASILGATQQQYSTAMAIPRQRVLPSIDPGNRP